MFTNLLLVILTAILLSACGTEERVITRYETNCDNSTSEIRGQFILECIKNGNPKSDEEPEDWIGICQRMAEDTYCRKRKFKVFQTRDHFGGLWLDDKKELID